MLLTRHSQIAFYFLGMLGSPRGSDSHWRRQRQVRNHSRYPGAACQTCSQHKKLWYHSCNKEYTTSEGLSTDLYVRVHHLIFTWGSRLTTLAHLGCLQLWETITAAESLISSLTTVSATSGRTERGRDRHPLLGRAWISQAATRTSSSIYIMLT